MSFARTIYKRLLYFGFDAKRFLEALSPKKSSWYEHDFLELKKQKGSDQTFSFGTPFPILTDKDDQGGVMKGHYFHQDLFIARKIHEASPEKHVDIGSRTDGFIAHVASYRQIELLDIRPIESSVKNISFRQANLMELPEDLLNYTDSISSLHAIEHFGLGRYGDPIDYWGYLKAIQNITMMLKQGGTFYFSVPIGPQRIEFNAHRVFSLAYLRNLFSQEYDISSFSYVNDAGEFHEDIHLTDEMIAHNCHCNYGCGIFILRKK
jgi:SAM-dependent methyltransferase